MSRMRVKPMLKRIHGRDPGKSESDDLLEMSFAGPIGFRFSIKLLEKFVSKEFHAHRSHFTEFNRRAPIMIEILLARSQSMEGMTGLVQDRFDIALDAD